jgi:hypothetical protein
MPDVRVHIDVEDILEELDIDEIREELDIDEIREELARRERKHGAVLTGGVADGCPMRELAEDLRTAFYARNASRFEDLLRQLDPRGPTPGLHRAAVALSRTH